MNRLDSYLDVNDIKYLDVYAHYDTGIEKTIALWMIDLTRRCGMGKTAAGIEIVDGIKSGKLIKAREEDDND